MMTEYSFDYENIKFEFSNDKTKIKADGSFFKGSFISHTVIKEYIVKLTLLQTENKFESEMECKSNAYFLGLFKRLDEEFQRIMPQ